ncbi:hypothetical protein [Pseudomonas sp. EA_35y_Pfl2_R5]|uniref:hypothetical protein n=1 Tax=Pseudomonas sp. EA_35y_Pfl2_R5 TaxID=3088690 RepID=UPI0030DC1816
MNKWAVSALAGLMLLVTVGWLWSRDEALSPQAKDWLEQAAANVGESPAYYQLMGMDASAGRDPQIEGRKRVALYHQRLLSQEAQPGADISTLAMPGRALCVLGAQGCLQRLRLEPTQRQALLSQHRELLQRYQQLLMLDAPHTVARPGLDEPIPNYAAVLRGNRLRALQALQLAEEGRGEDALALLQEDIRLLRIWLSDADNLIMKMTTVALIAQNLDALAMLYQVGLIPPPDIQQPLSGEERSLLRAMQREFAMVATGLTELRYQANLEQELGVSAWRLQWVYKPQMSINDSLPAYARSASESFMDAEAFVGVLSEPAPSDVSTWRRVRNPVGGILVGVAIPDFRPYMARLHDLDAKFVLFNRLGRPARVGGNPYSPNEQPVWDEKHQRMCFNGPLADAKQVRCLPANPPL